MNKLIFLIVLLSGSPAFADTLFDKCMAGIDYGAFKNTQMQACAKDELVRADRSLNAEYKAATARIKGDGSMVGTGLTVAQRAWMDYRDKWCFFESVAHEDATSDFKRLSCLADLTARQAVRIKNSY